MEDKIYTHKSKSIGRFMVLVHSEDYSLIQILGKTTERYVIVYKLNLEGEIGWAYGIYYSDLQNAVNDFYNEYLHRKNN